MSECIDYDEHNLPWRSAHRGLKQSFVGLSGHMRVNCKLHFEEEHEREQEEEKEYLHWIKHSFYRHFYSLIFKFKMGYVVPDIAAAKNYVIANGVALLLTYGINYACQLIAVCFYQSGSKEQNHLLERLLQTSRTLYWFGVATAFSIFPPFYYGIVSVSLGWGTLVAVLLMHIMCFVKKCDNERSGWSYCYLLYHIMIGIWMLVSLLLGYYWSSQQPLATDTNEG